MFKSGVSLFRNSLVLSVGFVWQGLAQACNWFAQH